MIVDPLTLAMIALMAAGAVGVVKGQRRLRAGNLYLEAHHERGPLRLEHLPPHLARLGREGRLISVALEGVQRQLAEIPAPLGPQERSPAADLLTGLQVQLGEWLVSWEALAPHDRDALRQMGADVAGLRAVLREEVERGLDDQNAMILGGALLAASRASATSRLLARRGRGFRLQRHRRRAASRQDRHLTRVLQCMLEIEAAMERTPRTYR